MRNTIVEERTSIRHRLVSLAGKQEVLQMTLQISTHLSNSTMAQTSFWKDDASPENTLCTCPTTSSLAILSVLPRSKYTLYRAIGQSGGTEVRCAGKLLFGAVQRWGWCCADAG